MSDCVKLAIVVREPVDPGGRLDHWLVQFGWMFTISREGALFDIIGRKRSD